MQSLKFYIHRATFYFAVFSILFLSSLAINAQQAEQPEACKELPDLKDFFVVDEIRGRLQREVPELQAKITEIKEIRIPDFAIAQKDLDDTNKKIEPLVSKPDRNEDDNRQLESLERFKVSLENFLSRKTVASYETELKRAEDQLPRKEAQLRCVNAAVSKFDSTPEQDFKFWMSVIFAVLIGTVIIGFFWTAITDEKVRRAVFAGQVGLQFIALFSIVIAIILFGITGILEAKELSALLGSLAGYILGRYSTPRNDENSSGNNTGGEGGNGGGGASGSDSTIAKIEIAPASASLSTANPTQQLSATATDAQNNPITPNGFSPQWSTDDVSVAIVSQTGLVTRVAQGNCNVTATANGVTSKNCAVTCS